MNLSDVSPRNSTAGAAGAPRSTDSIDQLNNLLDHSCSKIRNLRQSLHEKLDRVFGNAPPPEGTPDKIAGIPSTTVEHMVRLTNELSFLETTISRLDNAGF